MRRMTTVGVTIAGPLRFQPPVIVNKLGANCAWFGNSPDRRRPQPGVWSSTPMNTFELPNDPLFQLERHIAQRADELALLMGVDRGHALDPWRQAEREVWREVPALGVTRGLAPGLARR